MFPTVQENLSFEVAKTLAQAGFSPSHPAMSITWGQITEVITETLIDFGPPAALLSREEILQLAENVQYYLNHEPTISWKDIVRLCCAASSTVEAMRSTTH